jgi:hypothetical protein
MAGAMRRCRDVNDVSSSEEIAPMKTTQQGRCRRRPRRRVGAGGGRRRHPAPALAVPREGEWPALLASLPVDVAGLARGEGAFCRRRQVRSATDLLRLLLVYALTDLPLRLVCAWATLAEVAALSDVAMLGRLGRCLGWLQALVAAMLAARGVAAPPAVGRWRLRVLDGSSVSGPGSAGTDWRVHLSYDPVAQRLDRVAVTTAAGGEALTRFAFDPGDLALADRGYCRAAEVAHVVRRQADLVVRLNTCALPLLADASGDRVLDLAAWLDAAPAAAPSERPVGIAVPATAEHPAQRLPLRLVTQRLAPDQAAAGRRRARQEAARHGRTPARLTLLAAGFVLLLTSLPATDWPAASVLALYRFRWQIELQIKRLKGLLALDHLRTKDDTLAQVCLLARLLVALVLDHWARPLRPTLDAWADDSAHPCSLWRCTAAWLEPLRQALLGSPSLAAWTAALPRLRRFLCASPRHRPSQAQAARAFQRLSQDINHAAA